MCQLLLLPDKPGNTKYTPKHKLLPLRERPVERVSARTDACTIVELLAAILGGPQPIETADALLAHFNGRLSDLRRAPAHEIADIPGIGQQNAARIKAAVELGLRLTLNTEEDRPTIHNPADAAAMLQHEMSALEQEHLRVILLDTRNRVIDIVEIYHGSLNSAQVRVAELFWCITTHPATQRPALMTWLLPGLSSRRVSSWISTRWITWSSVVVASFRSKSVVSVLTAAFLRQNLVIACDQPEFPSRKTK